jgi:hypothetical protein
MNGAHSERRDDDRPIEFKLLNSRAKSAAAGLFAQTPGVFSIPARICGQVADRDSTISG